MTLDFEFKSFDIVEYRCQLVFTGGGNSCKLKFLI
jgi:hypothetical protein